MQQLANSLAEASSQHAQAMLEAMPAWHLIIAVADSGLIGVREVGEEGGGGGGGVGGSREGWLASHRVVAAIASDPLLDLFLHLLGRILPLGVCLIQIQHLLYTVDCVLLHSVTKKWHRWECRLRIVNPLKAVDHGSLTAVDTKRLPVQIGQHQA